MPIIITNTETAIKISFAMLCSSVKLLHGITQIQQTINSALRRISQNSCSKLSLQLSYWTGKEISLQHCQIDFLCRHYMVLNTLPTAKIFDYLSVLLRNKRLCGDSLQSLN